MTDLDQKALAANFELWHAERMPDDDEHTAFELYAIDALLKDQDLADDDIDFGHIGGPGDGGIDGIYFFVDGMLIRDDNEPIRSKPQDAELVLVQVKRSGGFTETAIDRITAFVRDALEWEHSVDQLTRLNTEVRDSIELFRNTYDRIIAHAPLLRFSVYYVTGSEATPHPNIASKLDSLRGYVASKISRAEVTGHFWDCVKLLDAVRAVPKQSFRVPTVQLFATDDEVAVVCLVRVTDLAKFLGDGTGGQRKTLLESNVRAYQGDVRVNRDIRSTLREGNRAQDFWWFNNGVTVLADSYHFAGSTLVMERPQIVNGLQTCQEVFDYVTQIAPTTDDRSVLLRVIIPPDRNTRNRIIKATNFQTSIAPISLNAMSTLHFNIEDRLKLYGLYYDRRKGEYRAQRKPRATIVSMRDLGKAVIAIALRRPDTARARPGTVLNNSDRYEDAFPDGSDPEAYATCIRIDRRIQEFLKSQPDLDRSVRADVRYYVVYMVTCVLTNSSRPSRARIASLGASLSGALADETIGTCLREILELYNALGGTDRVSKGPELLAAINQRMQDRWSDPELEE